MPTRNINLTDHYDSFVSQELEAGRYQNASEVVRAALRLLEKQEEEDKIKIEALRKANALGIAAYERGDYTAIDSDADLDKVFADIDAKLDP